MSVEHEDDTVREHENVSEDALDSLDDVDSLDDASVSLWEGDEGGLDFAQRHVLVALLKQRFISARTHPRDWAALVEHERLIRSRLNDLFLDLAIDRAREVAWKRQASSETGGRFPTLLYDGAWTREETLVLVHLRDRLRSGMAGGDTRVFVDREDIVDYIASFRPPHATDAAGDEKRARNAVLSIIKAGLLIGSATDDRYEISGAVEPLLPLELLTELLEALQRANGTDVAPTPSAYDEGSALFEDDPAFADGYAVQTTYDHDEHDDPDDHDGLDEAARSDLDRVEGEE